MLEKYIGQKCLVCGENFAEKDDIVVCPDCGTPYHRGCWQKEGRCINDELHESGASWQPQGVTEVSAATRCSRCGTENPPGNKFCRECGLPLSDESGTMEDRPFNSTVTSDEPQPFIPFGAQNDQSDQNIQQPFPGFIPNGSTVKLTPKSDIDGVALGDYMEYAGRNSFPMIASFIRIAATKGKATFNLGAFIFPEFYMFYRKMTKKGILVLLASFILSLPQLLYYGQSDALGMKLYSTSINMESKQFLALINLCSLLSIVLSILCGLYANYWYYTKAREEIQEIRTDETLDDTQAVDKIRRKGGTSMAGVFGAFVAKMLFSLIIWLVLALIF